MNINNQNESKEKDLSHIKKYPSIPRYGKSKTDFEAGDRIVIFEKLDGANACITREGDKLVAFSRNKRLSEDETLHGFYGFVQSLDVKDFEEGLLYYGEWLIRHKLDYGSNEGQFYLFDVYDQTMGEDFGGFIDHLYVIIEAHQLGLNLAPILYSGPFIGEEHIFSFIGKSELGEVGEGVVVKCYKKQKCVKFVSPQFAEMKAVKATKRKSSSEEYKFAQVFATRTRVEKIIFLLTNEGELEEGFGLEDMRRVLKIVGERVHKDIMNEEWQELPPNYDEKKLRGSIGKVVGKILREIINS